MADETKKETAQDNRSKYESPRATRLKDFQTGSGGQSCFPAGSGDANGCSNGTGALATCNPSGSGVANG